MTTSLLLTLAGLVIATAISLEGVLSGEKNTKLKLFLIALTFAGSIVAGVSAWNDTQDKRRESAVAEQKYKDTEKSFAEQKITLNYINQTVTDLDALNQLSSGDRFYVRVATGSQPVMNDALKAIEARFKGAHSSGLVAVRSLRANCSATEQCWALVFGNHLTLAAAEVFAHFADENGFPPPQQHAVIMPESKS